MFLLINLLLYTFSYGQDTLLVNGQYFAPIDSGSKFMRIILPKEEGRNKIEDYLLTGELVRSCYGSRFQNGDSIIFDGKYTDFYLNGNKRETGNYADGLRVGRWKMYYEDTSQVWATTDYYIDNGDTSCKLTSYYKSGKRKRVEYMGKDFDAGVCYAEDGKVIKFTPFEKMPDPGYGLAEFIGFNVKYPTEAKRNNIEGRINVCFFIEADGSVRNPFALNNSESILAKEAVRVVAKMPRWKYPGMQDDKSVRVYYTLPITFTLQD